MTLFIHKGGTIRTLPYFPHFYSDYFYCYNFILNYVDVEVKEEASNVKRNEKQSLQTCLTFWREANQRDDSNTKYILGIQQV